jgi:N-acetylglucosamine kinase-like BadF-type ATPase
MEQILAVDGGGTKCEALLMSLEGEALAFAAIYPDRSAAGDWGRGRSAQAALAAIRAVMKHIHPEATLHFIGGNGAATYQFLGEFKVHQVVLWHAKESESALAASGESQALIALAGTGAFGHLTMTHCSRHADSYGPLLGDWGGAYQIGREGLRAAMRSSLNERRRTALHEAVIKKMGFKATSQDLYGLIIHEGVRIFPDRTAVAGYAGLVDEVARAGDAVALRILQGAADELAETLESLVLSAKAEGEPLPLVGMGGVIQHSDLYWNRLCEKVSAFLPRVRPMRIDFPQSVGLALAGLGQAMESGVVRADLKQVRERLLATLPAVMANGKPAKGKA